MFPPSCLWPRASALSVLLLLALPWVAAADPPITERINVSSAQAQGNDQSGVATFSADGRFVAFTSYASNLVPGDTNASPDIFVRDRQTGTTTRESVDSAGNEGDLGANVASISADGRYVAFESYGGSLVPGFDLNGGTGDIFVHDRQTGATELVSVDAAGNQGNQHSTDPSISADGRFVSFTSDASNLVLGDTNGATDHFVHDRQTGATERVSVDSTGNQQGANSSFASKISPDGRFVLFTTSGDLVPGDTNLRSDVYLRDRQTDTTERVSVDSGGSQVNDNSYAGGLSADGRYLAFTSWASDLVSGDTNATGDVFVHDRLTGATERASEDSDENQAEDDHDSGNPAISADGRFVLFQSRASNLVPGDTNGTYDIFVRDLQLGTTERVSVDSSGNQASGDSYSPAISADNLNIAFDSEAPNLVPGDNNGARDTFVRGPALFVPDQDTDGDGVADTIDVGAGQFDDGAGTSGSITDRAGLDVTVADEVAPDGVKVTVAPGVGKVTLTVCGGFTLKVTAGSEVVVTCGSVKVQVVQGSAEVVLGGGLTVVSVPTGVTAKVSQNPDGSYEVENLGGGSVAVTVDGVQTTIAAGQTKSVTTLDFQGFTSPVDNPTVMNLVKAGQAVPFRWRLLRPDGSPYTGLTAASITVGTLACGVGSTPDQLEEIAPGESGLLNLGNGYYQLNWKSPKNYGGSCKVARLNLGEGVTRDAYFQFAK